MKIIVSCGPIPKPFQASPAKTRPPSNEWGESHNFTLNHHQDIKTACVELAVT